MFFEFLLIIVVSLVLLIHWFQNYSRTAKFINEFPGPKGKFLIGNLLDVYHNQVDLFVKFREFANTYRSTYRVWNIAFCGVNIVTAEDAEIMLSHTKNIDKSIIYDFLHQWLGTGLLTSTGSKWQQRRKLLTPAFHFNILKKFIEIFGEQSNKLVEDLKNECGKSKTNVIPFITKSTLQVICETAMGTNLDPKNTIQKSYFQAIYDIGDLIMTRIISPWMFNDHIFNLFPTGKKHKKIVQTLHKFTHGVIKEREANFKESDLQNLDKDDEIGKKKRLAMLDLLISAKRKDGSIDDAGIREEVDTFMFEGHDTTSVGVSSALLLLANHKDVQDKIYQELHEIFGDSKRPAGYEDLQRMQYLEMCLKECLRIFPSVPIIGRKLSEDMKLTKSTVPKDTFLTLHIFDLHRDPKVFPDPEKFDPDRFLPENVKGRHPYAYVPFSAGMRNCIGQKFAMLEMKSIISMILRNYILEQVDNYKDVKFKVDFVLRSSKEINIKFRPRV